MLANALYQNESVTGNLMYACSAANSSGLPPQEAPVMIAEKRSLSFFFCSAACKWLGAFLRNSSGGAVIVSHDQDLLQDACDQIVEVRGRQLHHYAGDYNLFLEQRELRSQQAASAALTQGKKIAELEGFVARFGAKASKASQAQSRAKQLEKIKSNMVAAPAASAGDGPGDARKVTNPWPFDCSMLPLPWAADML